MEALIIRDGGVYERRPYAIQHSVLRATRQLTKETCTRFWQLYDRATRNGIPVVTCSTLDQASLDDTPDGARRVRDGDGRQVHRHAAAAAQSELAVAEYRASDTKALDVISTATNWAPPRRSCVDLAIPTEDGYTAFALTA
jgi:hypothetical protein